MAVMFVIAYVNSNLNPLFGGHEAGLCSHPDNGGRVPNVVVTSSPSWYAKL